MTRTILTAVVVVVFSVGPVSTASAQTRAEAIAKVRADIAQIEKTLTNNKKLIIAADAGVAAAEFYLNFVAKTPQQKKDGQEALNVAKFTRSALEITKGLLELDLDDKRAELRRLLGQPLLGQP